MKFTGKRLADYNNAKQLYATKAIKRTDYSEILRVLESRERKAQLAKARRVTQQAPAPAPTPAPRAIAWEELRANVLERFPSRFGQGDIPFTLTLTSAVISGVSRDFNFKNKIHFEAFLDAVEKEGVKSDSANYSTLAEVLGTDENVFSLVIPTVKEVSAGCNHHKDVYTTFETPFYTLSAYNPIGDGNNCGFKIVEHLTGFSLSYSHWRKVLGVSSGTPLTTQQVTHIYRCVLPPRSHSKHLIFIDDTYNEKIDTDKFNYIFIKKDHYYSVTHASYKSQKDKNTKRGMLYWDIETRKTGQNVAVGSTRSYLLGDAILCVYYHRFNTDEYNKLTFVSGDNGKSSCRQFLDWLSVEANDGHFYHCLAHNGSRFDVYFLLSAMTEQEQLNTETQLRGYSIIGLQFKSHLFKDTCCFLTNSLENLCKSYKVIDSKMTEFKYNGETLTNKNICFYKPDLYLSQFIKLREDEPEFWAMYVDYCMRDCVSLSQVWSTFKREYDSLIDTLFKTTPQLKAKVGLMGSNTIGSLSRKILEATTYISSSGRLRRCQAYNKLVAFVQCRVEKGDTIETVTDKEKIIFMNNFKRGGISHTNQPGKHTHSLISYDIASQYPASMLCMKIPAGESKWVDNYSPLYNGFYHLKDLVFESDYKFKPIAGKNSDGVLEWATDAIGEVYLDTYMIKYLKSNYGLKSFTVVRGLVSSVYVNGRDIFGPYVNTLYTEKKRQDFLKDNGDKSYNPALRECIKLFLNSLSGKLVEDPSRYFKLEYTIAPNAVKLDGLEAVKNTDDAKYNEWITAGVMVYSYSKRLLFEYVRCLPNNSNDVIHIETDSVYFNKKHNEEFVKNINAYNGTEYPVKIGSDLGNVKVEKDTDAVSYFLGKKFYCIGDLYKIKGIPLKTIDELGNDVKLVDASLYEDIFNGKKVQKQFYTMKKVLFADETYISTHKMKRTISPATEYKLYN